MSRYDFNTGSETTLGSHDGPICSLEYSPATGQVISGSWDKTLRCWDARSSSLAGTYAQPGGVSCMSLLEHRLVVATEGRHVLVYDVRKMSEAEQSTETHVRFQTRSVCCSPDGTGFAMGSIDGRVIIDWFDPSEAQAKKYVFKCHRKGEGGPKIFYPVNALAFHPLYGTLATGGGDRHVNVWDVHSRKRLYQVRNILVEILTDKRCDACLLQIYQFIICWTGFVVLIYKLYIFISWRFGNCVIFVGIC
ncbi:hypothetical protein M758_9G180500 [Ceratodon purpureus]|nr:hypothetical protein M758_9G180500 [Ceratodon purpureus]